MVNEVPSGPVRAASSIRGWRPRAKFRCCGVDREHRPRREQQRRSRLELSRPADAGCQSDTRDPAAQLMSCFLEHSAAACALVRLGLRQVKRAPPAACGQASCRLRPGVAGQAAGRARSPARHGSSGQHPGRQAPTQGPDGLSRDERAGTSRGLSASQRRPLRASLPQPDSPTPCLPLCFLQQRPPPPQHSRRGRRRLHDRPRTARSTTPAQRP